MAQPNLIALTSVKITTAILEATNTETDLIPALATGHSAIVEAIFCSNIHATVVGWATVILKRSGTDHEVAHQLRVPVKQTVNALLGKPLYLFEGDSVRIIANASSNIAVFAPWADES